jgi:tetratricopeptide (TPR) repeat protein
MPIEGKRVYRRQGAAMIDQQQLFNVYSYLFVGFAGNALIGWQIGKKGVIGIGLEGPANHKVRLALCFFTIMVLWQWVGNLSSPFTTIKDAWPTLVAVAAFIIARSLIPRSQRLYDRAKFLHETTYVGDWRGLRTEEEISAAQNNSRLAKAERLYIDACNIQMQLAMQAEQADIRGKYESNVAITLCQLSLLYIQQARKPEAIDTATQAVQIGEALSNADLAETAYLNVLGDCVFTLGHVQKLTGHMDDAILNLRRSLSISEQLGDVEGADYARQLLDELAKGDEGA